MIVFLLVAAGIVALAISVLANAQAFHLGQRKAGFYVLGFVVALAAPIGIGCFVAAFALATKVS